MAIETKKAAQVFNLRTPYLLQGRTTELRASTERMTIMVKAYAEGGENAMHNHPHEDHSFIVLEGEATFHIETDGNAHVVGRYEGILIPKDVNYWFSSSGGQNLIMVRFGALYPEVAHGRYTPDGRDIPSDSAANKTVERIEQPGPGFGD
jgi:quercetin dioxygenase-like cupin family protein